MIRVDPRNRPLVEHSYSPPYVARPEPWMAGAACVGVDPELFYQKPSKRPDAWDAALAVCATCPVRQECLEYTMRQERSAANGRYGVAGGMTPKERQRLWPAWKAEHEKTRHQCGTLSGYKLHRHYGETPCAACKTANAGYVRQRRAERKETVWIG